MNTQATRRRVCACGTVLSQSNRGRDCSICEALRCDADILGNRRARQVLTARNAAAIYAHPEHHATNEDYLLALTHSLDQLCDALGMERPVFVTKGGDS